jgi:hypothetical protein
VRIFVVGPPAPQDPQLPHLGCITTPFATNPSPSILPVLVVSAVACALH